MTSRWEEYEPEYLLVIQIESIPSSTKSSSWPFGTRWSLWHVYRGHDRSVCKPWRRLRSTVLSSSCRAARSKTCECHGHHSPTCSLLNLLK